jgi:hypothetical protein
VWWHHSRPYHARHRLVALQLHYLASMEINECTIWTFLVAMQDMIKWKWARGSCQCSGHKYTYQIISAFPNWGCAQIRHAHRQCPNWANSINLLKYTLMYMDSTSYLVAWLNSTLKEHSELRPLAGDAKSSAVKNHNNYFNPPA